MTDLTSATWRKSTRSQGAENCVEVGRVPDVVGVRDTKDRDGGTLTFTPEQFAAFTASLRQA